MPELKSCVFCRFGLGEQIVCVLVQRESDIFNVYLTSELLGTFLSSIVNVFFVSISAVKWDDKK